MAYIRGEAREQTTMFPLTLDELIAEDHICRVIEGFDGCASARNPCGKPQGES